MTAAPARAWAYLALRRWRRRFLLTREKPGALIGVLLGLVLSVGAQIYLLRLTSGAQLPPLLVELVSPFAPFLLPVVALAATFRTPLRLDVADVSWLLTAPGGRRILLARHLFGHPVLLAVFAGGGAALARVFLGQPVLPAWKLGLVVGVVVLTVRLTGLLAHLAARHAAVLARLVVLGAGAGLAVTVGEPELRGEVLVQRWLLALLDPASVEAGWVLWPVAVAALLAALTIWLARGYVEAADERARQNAELQVTLRTDSSGLEVGANWFQSGMRSWSGSPRWTAERAFLFRGLAQQRRMLPAFGLELGAELAITIVLLIFAPGLAWLPVALVLAITAVTGSFVGIAVELDHHHLWLAPLRRLPVLLCVTAAPAAMAGASAEILWLAVLLGGGVSGQFWLAGALVIPVVLVTVLMAGALAVTVGGRGLLRFPLSFGFTAVGLAPAIALLYWPGPLVLAAVAIAMLALAATAAVLVTRGLWTSDPTARSTSPGSSAPPVHHAGSTRAPG
ncbi:hypothetical protein [Crossiella sp. CA198]|uniref:hypothetical protein n=1 Tax=Crossiella sp. CA198 TaxID=3455607 RepID=UPI003F8D5E73